MIVACQKDAYIRKMEAHVLSCVPRATGGFDVILDDTPLFPEGGGQPADHGWIADAVVSDVRRELRGDASVAIHHVDRAVAVGASQIEVDWDRRYDHMQQHTAQHLLTALAQDQLPETPATVAFHLGEETSTIDLDKILSADTLSALEQLANDAIRANLAVTHRLVDQAIWTQLSGTIRSRGLPDGHRGEIRLVEIDGVDLNTCGGTHVASTAELQTIVIVRTEKVRGGTRLHYLAGHRAIALTRAMLTREGLLTERLCAAPGQHVALVDKLIEGRKADRRAFRALQSTLAESLGAQLATRPGPVVSLHQVAADFAFLNAVARAAEEARAAAGRAPLTLLLTASSEGDRGVFMVTGLSEHVGAAGPQVAEVLAGRGGGGRGRYQGKAEALTPAARARAVEVLSKAVHHTEQEET